MCASMSGSQLMNLADRLSIRSRTLTFVAVSIALISGPAQAGYSTDSPIMVRLVPVADGLNATVDGVDQRFPTDSIKIFVQSFVARFNCNPLRNFRNPKP